MKIRYIFKRSGFLSNLRSKIAHETYQIRASLSHGRKIKFSRNLLLFEREIYCIQYPIFFHSLCSPISLYKYQASCTSKDTKPQPHTQPLFCQKISQSYEFRILLSSRFQGVLSPPLCSLISQQAIPTLTRNKTIQNRALKLAPIWYFFDLRFHNFMHY